MTPSHTHGRLDRFLEGPWPVVILIAVITFGAIGMFFAVARVFIDAGNAWAASLH